MRYQLEEYSKTVEITGYRGITFAKAEAYLKLHRKQDAVLEIQFFDAQLIATAQHLWFAVLNALQAFKGKTNLSKTPAMETMLYASAQRQIQRAIDRCGIKPQTTNLAVVIIGDSPSQVQTQLQQVTDFLGLDADRNVLEMTESKAEKIAKTFRIAKEEVETVGGPLELAIVNLVIERVALLATQL